MMILLAKVKACKTEIKESYKVINRLNCIKFHNSWRTMKIKSQLLRFTLEGFRFCKKSDTGIIKSITYKIYEHLIN